MFLDGKSIEYSIESTSQSWVLGIEYSHSIHNVVVNFNGEAEPESFLKALLIGSTILVAAVGLSAYVYLKKRKSTVG